MYKRQPYPVRDGNRTYPQSVISSHCPRAFPVFPQRDAPPAPLQLEPAHQLHNTASAPVSYTHLDVYKRQADYLKREELAVQNAAVTAEGAVCLAMEELPYTIDRTPVLVIGYGRIGRLLAKKLNALGAIVTVAARSLESRAWAQSEGSKACPIEALESTLPHFPLIFNTAPAEVLSESLLARVRRDCLIIDLASKPGGIDQLCARRLDVYKRQPLLLKDRRKYA